MFQQYYNQFKSIRMFFFFGEGTYWLFIEPLPQRKTIIGHLGIFICIFVFSWWADESWEITDRLKQVCGKILDPIKIFCCPLHGLQTSQKFSGMLGIQSFTFENEYRSMRERTGTWGSRNVHIRQWHHHVVMAFRAVAQRHQLLHCKWCVLSALLSD